MKCCSRSTLGVLIGILNVLAYTVGIIIPIIAFVEVTVYDYASNRETEIIFSVLLVACLIMLVISCLLIMGIVKRRHKLMLPWLILSGIIFVMEIPISAFYYYINLSLAGLIGSLIGIGFSALMIWIICTLYRDIRKNNI